MNAKLLSLFACVAFVAAQSSSTPVATSGAAAPSGTASLPPCVQTCLTQALTNTPCDANDTTCVCGDAFTNNITPCVSACTPEELQAAIQFQQDICGATGDSSALPSASGTGAATPSGTSVATTGAATTLASTPTRPASGASTSVGSATSAASSGAATSNAAVPIAAQGVWAMAAGLLGFAVAL